MESILCNHQKSIYFKNFIITRVFFKRNYFCAMIKVAQCCIVNFFIIILLIGCKSSLQQGSDFQVQEGDLLFQDSDCGPFCTSIEKVTFGYKGSKFSHVGLLMKDKEGLKVMEAITKGVVLTPIDSFLNRSFDRDKNPKVVVGRLKPRNQVLIPRAIDFVHRQMNKAYDEVFDYTNDKYYCSELIYDAFKSANNNIPIFKMQPMTFKDPETNQIFPIWKDYFAKLGHPIPEGELGLNPGGMSTSKFIDIIHFYGMPEGYVE